MVTAASITGVATGIAAGIAAGVAIEHATRFNMNDTSAREATAARDAWEQSYFDEFGADIERDTVDDARIDARLRTFVREHPTPEGVTFYRSGSSWSYDRVTKREEQDRFGVDLIAFLGGLFVGGLGLAVAFARPRAAPDMARFTGLGGAALVAAPALGFSFVTSYVTSAIRWDDDA